MPQADTDRSHIQIPSDYESLPLGATIRLYTGDFELGDEKRSLTGSLDLRLQGEPSIAFDLSGHGALGRIPRDQVPLSIPSAEPADALMLNWNTQYNSGGTTLKASGIVQGDGIEICASTAQGQPGPVGRVHFHLLNFPVFIGERLCEMGNGGRGFWTGRSEFGFGKWTVTLDQFRDADTRLKAANGVGGYAFTHVGSLRRWDGRLFNTTDAKKALEFLHWLFSLCRGSRCDCVLPTGYRYLSDPVWQLWRSPHTARGRSSVSWFNKLTPSHCFAVAGPLYNVWSDTKKRDWFKLAIGLYCAANSGDSHMELKLINAQVALEMLSCVAFLEESSLMSDAAFEALSAADKGRVLLFWLGVDGKIPEGLNALRSKCPKNQDAPQFVTEIRNCIAHPTKSNRAKRATYGDDTIYEAWRLNMWYLELTMLKLFGYTGPYINRVEPNSFLIPQVVPWSPAASTAAAPTAPTTAAIAK